MQHLQNLPSIRHLLEGVPAPYRKLFQDRPTFEPNCQYPIDNIQAPFPCRVPNTSHQLEYKSPIYTALPKLSFSRRPTSPFVLPVPSGLPLQMMSLGLGAPKHSEETPNEQSLPKPCSGLAVQEASWRRSRSDPERVYSYSRRLSVDESESDGEQALESPGQDTGKYKCSYCSKRFMRPSSLRTHVYSHTGEKPYICTSKGCGRRFSVQSNMRRHLRVHRLEPSQGSP